MLRDRRILITGGARGLGRAFAERALAAGARVVVADILEDVGRTTAREIGATFVPIDLARPDSIEAGVAAAAAALGGLDGLVNNGAITSSGGKRLEELDVETWDRVMAVNVRGTWLATPAAVGLLAASGKGRVVNVGSDTALWGAPKLLAYVASKGAVMAMTRAMARELGAHGTTVNTVAPGLTLVEATEYVPAERHQLYVDGRAINRAQMPEDVCGAVTFLLSEEAGFITGQFLAVNGGFAMH
jgi:NAD(P)-dependent dehydrogenase (short-subunit alcohol dehydrogenase family)